MELVEIKCAKCSKEMYLGKEYVREKMFCTLGCMESFTQVSSLDVKGFH